MVLEADAKIMTNPRGKTGILYIPSDIMVDSAFPFAVPARVHIKIEGDKLVIEKVKS
ncbi:MAG: hypothetical protein R3319_03760 [Candidatus Bathyarchaeia archaeon]|nr:hypothetical protein [Candidatus Bathyarchaeia archaeon]